MGPTYAYHRNICHQCLPKFDPNHLKPCYPREDGRRDRNMSESEILEQGFRLIELDGDD